jgi:hypothetical protein
MIAHYVEIDRIVDHQFMAININKKVIHFMLSFIKKKKYYVCFSFSEHIYLYKDVHVCVLIHVS